MELPLPGLHFFAGPLLALLLVALLGGLLREVAVTPTAQSWPAPTDVASRPPAPGHHGRRLSAREVR